MDDLDLLATDLRDQFDQIPQELLELRYLWLRVMLDVELARIGNEDVTAFRPPTPWHRHYAGRAVHLRPRYDGFRE